jgi:hypothetical protein
MASQEDKIYNAKVNAKTTKSGSGAAKYAANDYIWKGLDKTGLSPSDQNKLAKKLQPIVQSHIQEDFNKTAMRARIIETSQRKKEIENAKNEIMGGGKPKKKGK